MEALIQTLQDGSAITFRLLLASIQLGCYFIIIRIHCVLFFIGKVAWIRLDEDQVRFTIVPESESGSQVWASVLFLFVSILTDLCSVLTIESVFEYYII
jgi:Hus1-like protein